MASTVPDTSLRCPHCATTERENALLRKRLEGAAGLLGVTLDGLRAPLPHAEAPAGAARHLTLLKGA